MLSTEQDQEVRLYWTRYFLAEVYFCKTHHRTEKIVALTDHAGLERYVAHLNVTQLLPSNF
ncbi:hypothetical protein GCM10023183_17750 [Nibribacter koreensis]|uniref:Uncharacterized protein n=2 Tax=Nibribacter koreensis TaxID=1084519 RepID=A0ABP8FIF3_9BACT